MDLEPGGRRDGRDESDAGGWVQFWFLAAYQATTTACGCGLWAGQLMMIEPSPWTVAQRRHVGMEMKRVGLWLWMIQVIDEWIKTKNIHGSHCSCRYEPGAMREADTEQRATHENDRTNS